MTKKFYTVIIPEVHEHKVKQIAESVKRYAENASPGQYFSLKKISVSHTVPKADDPRKKDKKIDIKSLTDIIEIDTEKRICIAEAGIPFSELVKETLDHGFIPGTVPELKTITIGGAVSGCSIESMSYKYGGFHDSCLEYEIVTGTGEIIRCSRQTEPEIFEMVHGAFGTLGILTLIKFKLIPAKPYVRMEYETFPSFDRFLEAVEKHYLRRDLDFMDAIIHSPEKCVLCKGTFVEKVPYFNIYTRKIFYKSTLERDEDYLPTYHYLFRYDTECHWLTRNYGLENPLLRGLAGSFLLGSSNILRIGEKFPFLTKLSGKPDVVADVFVPYSNIRAFWKWYIEFFNYFPLWVVPYHIDKIYPWINPEFMEGIEDSLFIDCAIYGFRQRGELNYYRALEDKVFELRGVKTLITYNYYPEDIFWTWYNRSLYDEVKARTDPRNLFRNIYQKMNYTVR